MKGSPTYMISNKFQLLEEIGEIAFPPAQYGRIKLPGVKEVLQWF